MADRVPISYDFKICTTDEGVLYRIGDDDVWLPKACVCEDDDPAEKTVWVDEWLAVKEGLV